MNKIFFIIAFIALCAIPVNAQNYYAGASFAVSTVSVFNLTDDVILPAAIHVGVDDLGMNNLGVRVDGNFLINTNNTDNTVFGLGLSGIYNLSELVSSSPFGLYVGVGPRLLINRENNTANNDTTAQIGAGVLVGLDYYVLPQISVFGEARSDIYFTDPVTSGLSFGIGARYHFY